ncbi:type II and III secretion system protein [Akkermansiaceae bacterium]|nr:type II and III secretion system protein [Akkermansiaceae bacterium]
MQSKLTHPYIQDLRNNYLALIAGIHGKRSMVHLCVVLGMSLTAHSLRAESPGDNSSSIAQREIARRANLVVEADKALGLGRAAYAGNKYEEAVKQYRSALSMLPPGPALADRRETYTAHLGDASAALAQEYRRIGRYDEARSMLEGVIAQDPTNLAAKKQLGYLADPIRTNPALTSDHSQNVDQVRRHLYTGEGYYNLGKYSEAEAEFKKILQIDLYNKAARRWLERIANTKSDYYRAAYDQTRAELLMEVDRAWETAVPPELPDFGPGEGNSLRTTGVEYIQQKLNNIIIPKVDFTDFTVNQCLETLRLRAREFDFEQDPDKMGINFLIRDPSSQAGGSAELDGEADFGADAVAGSGSGSSIGDRKVDELLLERIPLGAVLEYICDKTRLRYKIDEHAVILLPVAAMEVDDLYTRTFTVPPDFISRLSQGGGSGGGGNDDPFGEDDSGGGALSERANAQTLFMDNGVSFPDNAFANYIASTSTLVVNNTLNNLDIIDEIIAVLRKDGPRQVRIMTKFIEVSQDNTDELGFDWIVSPFDLGGNGSNGIISGGSTGNGVTRNIGDLGNPNITPGATSVSNIATAGLRSGDYANTRNSIDSIINNPSRSSQATNVAPGILSITGLFDNGQAQMIMRGLSQKKGADVMTAPSILAKSGESATIEVIREFIYPTEYEPPELPQSVGTTSQTADADGGGGGAQIFPVTPATPTGFETRNTGVTLEIEPTIGENNYSIDLRFAPELVEFEGFINYGSPIQTLGQDILGNPVSITITENRIEMPVFATRRVTTGLTIYDGYTVAVGGLMREDVQNVEDSVPILGDLPIIGRLFQSKAESRIKSNLIIFVTAEIIDAAGSRINQPSSGSPGAGGVAPQSVMPLDGGDGLLPSR